MTLRPELASARTADSRPEPAPLTRTATSRTPRRIALAAAFSAASCAPNGVLLRVPLKPTCPAEPVEMTSPLVLVTVTSVLLKVALTCTTPLDVIFLIFFLTALPILLHPLHRLLAGDRLARSFARARVRARALPAHGQAAAVAHAAVAADVAQARDRGRDLTAQDALDRVLLLDEVGDARQLLLGEI